MGGNYWVYKWKLSLCSFIRSFILSFIHSFIQSFAHSLIRSFVRSFREMRVKKLRPILLVDAQIVKWRFIRGSCNHKWRCCCCCCSKLPSYFFRARRAIINYVFEPLRSYNLRETKNNSSLQKWNNVNTSECVRRIRIDFETQNAELKPRSCSAFGRSLSNAV